MSTSSSRRGFFARLFGAAAAGAVSSAGQAADPAPARCPHYVDGTAWLYTAGTTVTYLRHEAGCPFCGGPRFQPAVPASSGVADGNGYSLPSTALAGPPMTHSYSQGPG